MAQPKNLPKGLDLVTLGETMIRHFTRHHHRLEQCSDLGFSIAGSESNLAIAAARLGLRAGWIGKLVDNPLGQKVAREIGVHGVDVSRVRWTEKGRVGVFYIEFGSPPRPTQVLYDRKGSAASTLSPEEVDWDYVRSARWFHTTGITCALGKSTLRTVHAAIRELRGSGTRISLDVNYRALLWTPAQCRKTLATVLPGLDQLISTAADVEKVFGIKGPGIEQARKIQEAYGPRTVLITCGSEGAVYLDEQRREQEIRFDRYPVTPVDRIGTGDAFAAGFFLGLLEKGPALGLEYGAATCAWKFSVPGDHTLISREEMLAVVRGAGGDVSR